MKRILFGSFTGALGTVLGLLILIFIVVVPFAFPHDITSIDVADRLQPPSAEHWFGTDENGRDLFVRLAVGGAYSLICAFVAVILSGVIGLVLGGVAGYLGGWVDTVIMRVSDALQGFPQILLALLIAFSLGNGLPSVTIAIAVSYWPFFTKISRNLVLSMRTSLYIQSAVTQGARWTYIVRRHVLPSVFPPLLTQMTMALGEAIIVVAGLSLIGLGAQEPTPEWGSIIAASMGFVFQAPWYPLFAGLTLFMATLAFNLIGDSLRENVYGAGASTRGDRVIRLRRRRAEATGPALLEGAPGSVPEATPEPSS